MNKFDIFKKEYGPLDAPRATVGGEICRAVMLLKEEFEKGYKLGAPAEEGAGRVNFAGRYLCEVCKGGDIEKLIDAIWGLEDNELYRFGLVRLGVAVMDFLVDNPYIENSTNRDDMWNYCDEDDFEWPEEEEEEQEVYNHLHPWAVYDPY